MAARPHTQTCTRCMCEIPYGCEGKNRYGCEGARDMRNYLRFYAQCCLTCTMFPDMHTIRWMWANVSHVSQSVASVAKCRDKFLGFEV